MQTLEHESRSASRPRPAGYLGKAEAAAFLGISPKTLDRRRRSEGVLPNVLRKGRELWFPVDDVRTYFELCKNRGYI